MLGVQSPKNSIPPSPRFEEKGPGDEEPDGYSCLCGFNSFNINLGRQIFNETISVSTTGGGRKTQLVGFSIGAGYAQ
jgi:hypothetical protein